MNVFVGYHSLHNPTSDPETLAGLLHSFCATDQYFCVLTPNNEENEVGFSLSLCKAISDSVVEIFSEERIAVPFIQQQNCIGIEWQWLKLEPRLTPLLELIHSTSLVILSKSEATLDSLLKESGVLEKGGEDTLNTEIEANNLHQQPLHGMTPEDAAKAMMLEERMCTSQDMLQQVLGSIKLLESMNKSPIDTKPLSGSFSCLTGIRPPQSEDCSALINSLLNSRITFQAYKV